MDRLTRRRLLVLPAALALGPLPALSIPTSEWCAAPEEVELLGLVNELRVGLGLPPLTMSQTLGAAAEHHSLDMATKRYFSHTLADGTTWSKNMTNHGYTAVTYRGENLAAGFASAAKTFEQWKNSPGHFANMVNSHYRAIGVGRAYDAGSPYRWYWAQCFGGFFDRAACAVAAVASDGTDVAPGDGPIAELVEAVADEPPETTLPGTGSGSGL